MIKRLHILFLLLFSVLTSEAQVTVSAKLDSVQFFVGNQDGIQLDVTMPKGHILKMPAIKAGDVIAGNIEVVDVSKADTSDVEDGDNLYKITQRYTITVWDSALCVVPSFAVKVDGKVYRTNPLGFKVLTVDVDTLHADNFCPPRGIQNVPFEWDDWKSVVYWGIMLILCVVAIIFIELRLKRGKPIFRFVRRKKKIPAHEIAISEIERIKSSRNWTGEDSKEYYTELTDALRTYIQNRYSFSALEMTSNEIIEKLRDAGDEKSLAELREIFSTADLVKFAKWSTQLNERDAALVSALEYVNVTKIEEDPNATPEPEVVKETDRQRLNEVIAMRIIVVVTTIGGVCIIIWMIWRLWDLLA